MPGGWINITRRCPYCGKQVPKYMRRCMICRRFIKNHQGRVFAK